jgi:membrane protease subunit (stomatin/prohibitin family)
MEEVCKMKIVELASGIKTMITNEQQELVKLVKEQTQISRTDLDERKQKLAEQMTSLGLLDRIYDEENQAIIYKLFSR